MNKFSIGDVVKLKSGGPEMTVATVLGIGLYTSPTRCKHNQYKR
jgi:uncharacterized protein YodC (DUF2158 family)